MYCRRRRSCTNIRGHGNDLEALHIQVIFRLIVLLVRVNSTLFRLFLSFPWTILPFLYISLKLLPGHRAFRSLHLKCCSRGP